MRRATASALILAATLPVLASDFAWIDTDWSAGQYVEIVGIDPDIWPGQVVLTARPEQMLFLDEPTDFRGIYGLTVYHDTLFLAASDYPFIFDGAEVITYDFLTEEFAVAYEPYESGLNIIKQFGDSLYIPGPDPMDPWTDDGSIYLYNGEEWIEKETVPTAVHVCDVEVCNDIVYVTTGQFAEPYHGYGCVWISYDWGDSWTRVLDILPTVANPARRFFGLGSGIE